MIGSFVKVEADRGEDLGIVIDKTPSTHFPDVEYTAGQRGYPTAEHREIKRITRLATIEERERLQSKFLEEETALHVSE